MGAHRPHMLARQAKSLEGGSVQKTGCGSGEQKPSWARGRMVDSCLPSFFSPMRVGALGVLTRTAREVITTPWLQQDTCCKSSLQQDHISCTMLGRQPSKQISTIVHAGHSSVKA